MHARGLFSEHLLAWIVAAALLGIAVPDLAFLALATIVLLAVMIGSTSLALDVGLIRRVRRGAVAVILAGHVAMALLAFGAATAFKLPREARLGLVVVGAVTPELAAPVLTRVAGGNTAFAIVAILATGLGSLVTVPAAFVLAGEGVDAGHLVPLLRTLALGVVLPMIVAAAVVLAAGLPAEVALPAAVYGLIEMVTASGLATRMGRARPEAT